MQKYSYSDVVNNKVQFSNYIFVKGMWTWGPGRPHVVV